MLRRKYNRIKKMEYTVYKHIAPNHKVYIGITSKAPASRWKNGWGYANNPHFKQAIAKYGWERIEHHIVATGLTKQEAERLEKQLIAEYNSADRRYGYNVLAGGDVTSGGWHHTEEAKSRIAQAQSEKKLTEKQMLAIAEYVAAKKRRIAQYDISGMFMQIYESACDAEKSTGVSASNIIACCRGRYNSMNNYMFRYADKPPDRISPYKGKRIAINMYSVDGKLENRFESAREAEAATGVANTHIADACRFRKVTAGGYLWLYEHEADRLPEKIEQYKNLKHRPKICARKEAKNG